MDRLGFWGPTARPAASRTVRFQYPLMDRLGFWGHGQVRPQHAVCQFQYPLMDRLGFWGPDCVCDGAAAAYFSIR